MTVLETPKVQATTEETVVHQELAPLVTWWRGANYLSVGQVYLLDNPGPLVARDIEKVPGPAQRAAGLRQRISDERLRARAWTRAHGEGDPAITEWTWPSARAGAAGEDS